MKLIDVTVPPDAHLLQEPNNTAVIDVVSRKGVATRNAAAVVLTEEVGDRACTGDVEVHPVPRGH